MTTPIVPVVLSGGIGSRLWPASRRSRPKQLLDLTGTRSMIAETVVRSTGVRGARSPIIVTNRLHAEGISEELRTVDVEPKLLLEPVGRNTAPAVAAAALVATDDGTDPLLLVLPSDHAISDVDAFIEAVQHGSEAAVGGKLVTFGIQPTAPETGYGYIRTGEPITDHALAIDEFREKPDATTAAEYLREGTYLWNSGMFLFSASTYLDELSAFDPHMIDAVRTSVERARDTAHGVELDAHAFGSIDGDSIDYAVMEKTERAAVVPCDIGWNDVGSWAALWDMGSKDSSGNVIVGDVMTSNVEDSYIRAESRLVAVIGVDDVVVVETEDAVLVVPRHDAQAVKDVVDRLEAENRPELDTNREEST